MTEYIDNTAWNDQPWYPVRVGSLLHHIDEITQWVIEYNPVYQVFPVKGTFDVTFYFEDSADANAFKILFGGFPYTNNKT